MRVNKITIRNIMGVRDYEIEPGAVTEISGKNGKGKSSIMAGILGLISGGHDGKLLTNGEEEGEVVIVLDDNIILKKSITATDSKTSAEVSERKVKASATYIKELFGSGFNPAKFLSMDEKERIKEVLKAVPISIPTEQIISMSGEYFPKLDLTAHPLKIIDTLRQTIFEDRTYHNRLATDADTAKSTLEKSLVNVGTDVKDQIAELDYQINAIQEKVSAIEKERENAKNELKRALDEQIQILKNGYMQNAEVLGKAYEESTNLEKENLSKAKEEKASLSEKLALSEKQEYTRKQVEELKEKEKTNREKSAKLTDMIYKIDSTKKSLTQGMVIAGKAVSIESGVMLFDGLPFDKINTAERVKIAVDLAIMNCGQARFAVVDGAECLDSETLDLLSKKAYEEDLQLLMFAVSDDPELKTETLI